MSVTRTQRLGTTESQITVRFPAGAGFSPRNVRSVKTCPISARPENQKYSWGQR